MPEKLCKPLRIECGTLIGIGASQNERAQCLTGDFLSRNQLKLGMIKSLETKTHRSRKALLQKGLKISGNKQYFSSDNDVHN